MPRPCLKNKQFQAWKSPQIELPIKSHPIKQLSPRQFPEATNPQPIQSISTTETDPKQKEKEEKLRHRLE